MIKMQIFRTVTQGFSLDIINPKGLSYIGVQRKIRTGEPTPVSDPAPKGSKVEVVPTCRDRVTTFTQKVGKEVI